MSSEFSIWTDNVNFRKKDWSFKSEVNDSGFFIDMVDKITGKSFAKLASIDNKTGSIWLYVFIPSILETHNYTTKNLKFDEFGRIKTDSLIFPPRNNYICCDFSDRIDYNCGGSFSLWNNDKNENDCKDWSFRTIINTYTGNFKCLIVDKYNGERIANVFTIDRLHGQLYNHGAVKDALSNNGYQLKNLQFDYTNAINIYN